MYFDIIQYSRSGNISVNFKTTSEIYSIYTDGSLAANTFFSIAPRITRVCSDCSER